MNYSKNIQKQLDIATEAFCKDIFISEYSNYYILLKAAKYLGCTCQIKINNEEVKFAK